MSRGVGISSPHALASATVAPSPTPSTLAVPLVAQSSPAPFPYENNSAERPLSKRLRPTSAIASRSSSTGRSVSPLDHTASIPLFPDLGGTSASATPHALELPLVSMPLRASN